MKQYQRRGYQPELPAFIAFMFALSLSLLAETSLRVVTSASLKLLGYNFLNTIGIWLSLFSFLWFAAAYSGNTRWLNRWTVGIAVGTPVVLGLLSVLNPEYLYEVNGLVMQGPVTVLGITFQQWVVLERDLQPAFLALNLYAYGVLLLGCGILSRYLFRNRGDMYTGQAVAVAAGIMAPLVVAVLLIGRIIPPELSATGVAYGITGIAFAVAVFRYRLLRVVPVGRQRLVERMNDPMIMLDNEECVVDCNPAARKLLGAPTGWRGMAAEEFFSPLSDQAHRLVKSDAIETTISVPDEGTQRHFAADISRISTDQGAVQGRLILLREVTAQKERERELQRQNERLDQFASTLSHDLRNPLSVAQGSVELAQTDVDSEHLDTVQNAHEQMGTLIEDLLTFARSGDPIEEPTPIALATVAEAGWELVETPEATLRVETDRIVRADQNRLQQLLANLFRNAIEHAGPAVTVTIGAVDGGFYVADDGPGIPDGERTDIFERGYSTSQDGTGFGLAIVAEIVDAHGWEIRLADSSDSGARFEITAVDIADE